MSTGLTIRSGQNRKIWYTALVMALVGAMWPPLFYNGWFLKGGADLESHFLGLMLILCPPYIVSMAFDHMETAERVKTIWFLSGINALIYAVLGLLIALVYERFVGRRDSIQRH